MCVFAKIINYSVVLFVTLIVSGSALSQNQTSDNDFSERGRAHARTVAGNSEFNSLVKSNPDEEYTVMFSFKNNQKIDSVIQLVEGYNLKLSAFRHRRGTETGGYKFNHTMNPYDAAEEYSCLLYTSPSPRDGLLSRMPSSA